jgi:hypothetical protein
MSDPRVAGPDALIASLAAEMRPVRRLATPWRRTAVWFCGALWLAGILALFTNFTALAHRLAAAPDMWLAMVGALVTTITAATAAFMTSVPGRSPWWAALPLPPVAVWVGASGLGCLRQSAIGWTGPEGMMHPMLCFYFIVLVSAPLSALLMWQIMRAFPLRPALTASLAGLASAGAAASLLTMIHPFDANALDLGVHLIAIVVVVLAARIIGARQAAQRLLTPDH